jgi:hypothetical protein
MKITFDPDKESKENIEFIYNFLSSKVDKKTKGKDVQTKLVNNTNVKDDIKLDNEGYELKEENFESYLRNKYIHFLSLTIAELGNRTELDEDKNKFIKKSNLKDIVLIDKKELVYSFHNKCKEFQVNDIDYNVLEEAIKFMINKPTHLFGYLNFYITNIKIDNEELFKIVY